MVKIRHEVVPFIGILTGVAVCAGFLFHAFLGGAVLAFLGVVGLLFFFRDPDRNPPNDGEAILSGADGRVMSVTRLEESQYLKTECFRISVFLSILDVHVNRSPITGHSKLIGYFPGKKFFTFQEKSSEFNQHNKILVEGLGTRCLIAQIVGPVVRRVVYWLDHEASIPIKAGDRIGMMKFGSRLDVYLPVADVVVLVQPGDSVRAGETIIARIKSAREKVV